MNRMNSDAAAGRLSRDTEAVLLLCGVFEGRASGGVEPLTTREYNEVACWPSVAVAPKWCLTAWPHNGES